MAGTGAPASGGSEFFPSIALIRAIAALMVVYDHFLGVWLERNRVSFAPAQFADRWLFEPLHIMAHGGRLAVAMFFLVSGFVIVYVGERETLRSFAIRRLLRIYPPLWASIALLLIAYLMIIGVGDDPVRRGYAIAKAVLEGNPVWNVLAAMSLVNFLIGTPAVNGVAWTLIIEMLFYVAVACLLPWLRTRPVLALGVAFAVLAFLQAVAKTNAYVFLLAVNSVYVAYLFLGSLVYFRWIGRIGNRMFAVGSIAFAALFMHGLRAFVVEAPLSLNDYGVSYLLAWLVFVVLLLLDDRIRLGRVTSFFSRISYSLYLNHGGLGMLLLTILYPWLGYPVSLVVAFAFVVAVSWASWRYIELPSQRLARGLTRAAVAS